MEIVNHACMTQAALATKANSVGMSTRDFQEVFIALPCPLCADYIVTFNLVNCGSSVYFESFPCIVFSTELCSNTIWPTF